MGIAGLVGSSGDIAHSLVALNRGAFRCAAEEVRTWRLQGAQLGICADATSAEEESSATRLLFDGRIHDRTGLLDDLKLHDASNSNPSVADASLLLYAWLRFHEDFPNRVAGEYSFAIWEARRRRLILGSDPLGKHGMYYWQSGNSFRFASEIGGLLTCPEIPIVLDDIEVARWLTRHAESGDETLYKSIRQVPAGQLLLLEDGKLRLHRYWRPEELPTLRLADPRDYAEGLLHHLQQAARCRIYPGHAVGSHLSGGLDSSTVTTLAAGVLAEENRTGTAFTAVPARPLTAEIGAKRFGDERHHAASVIERNPNLSHVLIPNNATPLFDALDHFSCEHFDPIPNAANAPWIVGIFAEAQRRGIRTLLSGSAGNLTASYSGPHALSELLAQGRWLDWLRMVRDRRQYGGSIRGSLSHSLGNSPAQARFRSAVRDRILTPLRRWRGNYLPPPVRGLYEISAIRPEFFRASGLPPQLEINSILQPESSREFRLQLLKRAQRSAVVAAAKRVFGLEYTDPMTDRRLVEYCISLPEEAFCQRGLPRSLIRDAMQGKLPETVRLERRVGLQAADAATLMADNRAEIAAEVERMRSSDLVNRFIDMPALSKLVDEWPSGDWPNDAVRFAYQNKLLRGVSFGRFARCIEDGSLFASLRQGSSAPDARA
jgi:asparagine synthase (glutamine-hydrolysing)